MLFQYILRLEKVLLLSLFFFFFFFLVSLSFYLTKEERSVPVLSGGHLGVEGATERWPC